MHCSKYSVTSFANTFLAILLWCLQDGHALQVPTTAKNVAIQEPFIIDVASDAALNSVRAQLQNLSVNTSSGIVATVTNHVDLAKENLCLKGCRYPTLILHTTERWPGNLFKTKAFQVVASALPAKTEVLFTDCCDVLFRPESPDIFKLFHDEYAAHGKDVVFGATRSWAMLTSSDGKVLQSNEKRLRFRGKNHDPQEYPANSEEERYGVPHDCGMQGPPFPERPRCLQAKFPNSGSVIGMAASLSNFYSGSWNNCKLCVNWDKANDTQRTQLLQGSSDQNEVMDYLLTTQFCNGSCTIDYGMNLFHVTSGFIPSDYIDGGSGQLLLRLPNTSSQGKSAEILVRAPVIHAPGGSGNAEVIAKIQKIAAPLRASTYTAMKTSLISSEGGLRARYPVTWLAVQLAGMACIISLALIYVMQNTTEKATADDAVEKREYCANSAKFWLPCFLVVAAGVSNVLLKDHMASMAGGFHYPCAWNLITMCGMSLALPLHMYRRTEEQRVKASETPTYIYVVNMLLHWVALFIVNWLYRYLPGALLQLLRGSKVPLTAVLSFFMLGRCLTPAKRIGLLLAIASVGLAVQSSKEIFHFKNPKGFSHWFVILASFISELLRSVMFVWQEKYVKCYKIPPLQMAGVVGAFGVPFSIVALTFCHASGLEDLTEVFEKLFRSGSACVTAMAFLVSVCTFEVGGVYVSKQCSATTRAMLEMCRTPVIWGIELMMKLTVWNAFQALSFVCIWLGNLFELGLVF